MKGLTALITGASGGIGGAICKRLAEEGVNIVAFGGTNADKLQKFASELQSEFPDIKVFAFPCDVTDEQIVRDNFALAAQDGIDILINNAGRTFSAPVEKTDMEIYDKIMQINFRAPVLITKLALPYLKKSLRADVVNIASVVAHEGYPLQSAYSASKHALLGFTKSLAAELYQENVRVHVVSPGGVFTDMVKISRPDLTGDGMTQPSEVAEIVAFLLKFRNNAIIDEIRVHRSGKCPF
ncbi:MAG: SDR family oxidoreductase [Clostridia bacterium]|nr:SDR family oxidoreductase [Clostridia bacterium]